MKTLHLLFAIVIVATLLVACAAPTPTAAPAAPAAPATSAPAKAPASGEPIAIGLSKPLSGAGGTLGQLEKKGFDLAIKEINAAGGVLGRPLKTIWEDNKGDPAEGVATVTKLLERDKVSFLVCCYQSSVTLAAQPIIAKYGTPTLALIPSNPTLTEKGYNWFFRIKPTSNQESGAVVDYVVNKMGWKKVAFIAVNNDWGRGEVTAYKAAVTKVGAQVVFEEYHQTGELDFYAMLTKLKNAGADGVIMTTDYEQLGNLNKQFVELGLKIGRMLTSGNQPHVVAGLTSKEVTDGMYATTAYLDYSPDDPAAAFELNKRFYEAYMKEYPGTDAPSFAEANGYTGAFIVADAIKRAGSLDKDAISKALKETNLQTVRGPVRFDQNGQMQVTVWVREYKGGKYKVLFSSAGGQ